MQFRKGIIIFCLATLTLLSFGSFILFSILKQYLHAEMHELIRTGAVHKETQTLKFTDLQLKNLNWVAEDEFILNGEFYDVIAKTKNGKSTELLIVCDGKEKKLFEGMSVFKHEGKNGAANSGLLKIGKLISLKYLENDKALLPTQYFTQNIYIQLPMADVASPLISSFSPPPEFS